MQASLHAKNDADVALKGTARTAVTQKQVLADKRPEAMAQRILAAMMNNSPRVLQRRALSHAIYNSPRMVTQRKQMDAFFGGVVQQQEDGAMPVETLPAQPAGKINKTGLPDHLKSGIESLSGMSMDHVRVNYNSDKPAQLQAHAYAQGNEIYLGAGQEKHLPHEAWHVVQQAQGRVKPTLQMKTGVAVNDDAGLEAEADLMGAAALGAVQMHQKGDVEMLELSPVLQSKALTQLVQPRDASSGVVQRVPADFVGLAQGLKEVGLKAGGFFGFLGSGMSPWHKILSDLDAYAKLNADHYAARRDRLTLLQEHITEWQLAYVGRIDNPKKLDEQKSVALISLQQNKVAPENDELSVALHGTLVTPDNLATSADPAITKRTEKCRIRDGTQVFLEKKLTTPKERAIGDLPASIMMETANAFQVQFADTSQFYDSAILAPEIVWQVRWVPKALVVKDEGKGISAPRADTAHVAVSEHLLFPHKPNKADVQQGGLGDCYLLAALISIVSRHPDAIPAMMKDNRDGTVTVRLYDVDSSQIDNKQFTAKYIKIAKSVVQSNITHGDEFARGSLWVQLIEKAYVSAGYVGSEDTVKANNSYGDIESGSMNIAWEHLLGQAATRSDIVKQIDAPVPDGISPWGAAEKQAYQDATQVVGGGTAKPVAYAAMASFSILDQDAARTDAWMTFVNAHDIQAGVMALAQKGNVNYKAEIRLDDFTAYFQQNNLEQAIAQKIVDWLAANKFYPGKRGTGKYTTAQLDLFQQIRAALKANKHVGLGSDEHIARASGGFGQSAGEPTAKGLAGRHAYAVLEITPDKNNDALDPGEVIRVRVRNPWGNYGRTYQVVKGRSKARTNEDAAESELDLADVSKRFQSLYRLD